MTRIGRYEILEELGRGGFATVYKARDTQLNRLVALKVLHAGWSDDPDFVRRFQQEAEAIANLRHPNIVVIHDVDEIDRQMFIAMEYLPGENLQSWLANKEGPLTIAEALSILEPMASALDYAHEQGIIHRDVKPGNMMILEKGDILQVVLMDFGLVKAMENSVALTTSGQTLGSPEYMAPEQADPNRQDEIGPPTDLYAFGVVAYQLLAGRVPFPGNSISTLNAHVNLKVPSPQQFNKALPDSVAVILLKMLAKSPGNRFSTATAFVEELQATQSDKDGEPEPSTGMRNVPVYVWGIAIVLLIGLIWLGSSILTGQKEEQAVVREIETPVPDGITTAVADWTATESEPGIPSKVPGTATNLAIAATIDGTPAELALVITPTLVPTMRSTTKPTASPSATSDPSKPPMNPTLGSIWTRPIDDMVMVFVPTGRFMMGSNPSVDPIAGHNERPQHEVELDGFWIDQTEVTNAQYNRCVSEGKCERSEHINNENLNGDDQPVVGVSWFDAESYCKWVGVQLPTEAQWEYAARGEEVSLYPWGNEFDGELLNFCDSNCPYDWKDDVYDDGFEMTAPVASYQKGASWINTYDMAGNAWEWVADWYDEDYYDASPIQNPKGPSAGETKVLRGGSWGGQMEFARSTDRYNIIPTLRLDDYGFRCASLDRSLDSPTGSSTASTSVTPTLTPKSTLPVNPTPISTKIRPADDMVMVYVPAGKFMMGSDWDVDPDTLNDEQPQHEVELEGFWIDLTEVTNAQYNRCVSEGKCERSRYRNDLAYNPDDKPVVGVSWFDAESYCRWAGGQLPTEAQWEYAARGEEGVLYPWGNEFDGELLNFCDTNCNFDLKDDDYNDGYSETAPVGTYPGGASWVGAYDMAGNVWEWTNDWYDEDYYDVSPAQNPTGPSTGAEKVLRGGCWIVHLALARSANRDKTDPTGRFVINGFRCATPGP